MDLGESKTVYTPEQVAVTYELAGLGTRFAAVLLDTCLQSVLILVVLMVAGLLTIGVGALLEGLASGTTEGWLGMASAFWIFAIILVVFTLYWGYFLFFETVWHGQTPGKRVCGIRVMRDGGFPIDFPAAFVRNILRVADVLPFLYGVGTLSIFLSKESKRLGDYAAGTIVVADARQSDVRRAAAGAQPPPAPDYQVLGDPALLNLRAVTREQFAVVERFLARRAELPEKVSADLARQIAAPLMVLIGLTPPAEPIPYDRFLAELAIAYRSSMGA